MNFVMDDMYVSIMKNAMGRRSNFRNFILVDGIKLSLQNSVSIITFIGKVAFINL